MNEKVSIIVPIYKVEKYLDRCIKSIVDQTYKNLEIILVDDESPDKCPKICDGWAKKDKRIKVIHKKNGGLSDARNEGIKKATGSYIGFVDSDDYIEPNMYELLLNNLLNNNCDISICSFYVEFDSGAKTIDNSHNGNCEVFDSLIALKYLILDKKITNHAWNKLYRKSLFDKIKFPAGKKFEDIAIMYKLFEQSDRIALSDYIGYHYIQRSDSILGNVNEILVKDYEEIVLGKNEYLLNKYPEFDEEIKIDNLKTYKNLFYFSIKANLKSLLKSKKFKEHYRLYRESFLKNRKRLINNIGRKEIFSYDILWFSKTIYSALVKAKN
jgi:glycosyltransferase involved in cell wall biosynthesis